MLFREPAEKIFSTKFAFARAACRARAGRTFERWARRAPTSSLWVALGPGQGCSRTMSFKVEGYTLRQRALAVTGAVGVLVIPPWLREARRPSAAWFLKLLQQTKNPAENSTGGRSLPGMERQRKHPPLKESPFLRTGQEAALSPRVPFARFPLTPILKRLLA